MDIKDKNTVIVGYSETLTNLTAALMLLTQALGNNVDVNSGLIKSINLYIESIKGQTVILQTAIEQY